MAQRFLARWGFITVGILLVFAAMMPVSGALSGAFAAPVMFGAAGAVAAPDVRASAIPEAVDCTFAHPQYAGKCVEKVTPAEKQTPVQACRVILDCLNNSQCVKTYCQSTTIRGGWSLVSPKEKER